MENQETHTSPHTPARYDSSLLLQSSLEKPDAWFRIETASKFIRSNRSTASMSERLFCPSKKTPVVPVTVSSAPPAAKAMTGLPHDIASTGAIPKSSSDGKTSARQRAK